MLVLLNTWNGNNFAKTTLVQDQMGKKFRK